MGNSFEVISAGASGATGCQCMRLRKVPKKRRRIRGNFRQIPRTGNRQAACASLLAEPVSL
jgi:hypothetical protein